MKNCLDSSYHYSDMGKSGSLTYLGSRHLCQAGNLTRYGHTLISASRKVWKMTQFQFSDLILGMRHCCRSRRQFYAGSAPLNGSQGEAAALLTSVTIVTAATGICVSPKSQHERESLSSPLQRNVYKQSHCRYNMHVSVPKVTAVATGMHVTNVTTNFTQGYVSPLS